MTRGRKTMGSSIADTLPGSDLAQKRMRMILATLSGEMQVPDACEELGVNEARFHKMRRDFLGEAITLLEPRKPGRKPKEPTPEEQEISRLRAERRELVIDLEAARIRTEIALTMPHLLKDAVKKKSGPSNGKKNDRKQKRRKRRQ